MHKSVLVLSIFALGLLPSAAEAADWTVVRLRGPVFALEQGQWVPLARGAAVPDNRMIQTARNGRVTFQRDAQTIDLGPDTQVQIVDFAGGSKTTVWQHQGQVEIEAEARDVQHFSVQTPFLAAVVKGTRFSVSSDGAGSEVDVSRGRVEVQDLEHGFSVGVSAGQSASVSESQIVEVVGPGPKEQILTLDGRIPSPVQQRLIEQQQGTQERGRPQEGQRERESPPDHQRGDHAGNGGGNNDGGNGNGGQGGNGNGNGGQGGNGNGNGGQGGNGNGNGGQGGNENGNGGQGGGDGGGNQGGGNGNENNGGNGN